MLIAWKSEQDSEYYGGGYYECPHCKERLSWGAYLDVDEFRYCPWCGERVKNVDVYEE